MDRTVVVLPPQLQFVDLPPNLVILPTQQNVPRPSHVIVSINALGFEHLEINSGILEFDEATRVAIVDLPMDMVAANAPRVENVVSLNISDTSKFHFEVAIYNPLEYEVSVTQVVIDGGHFGPVGCAADAVIYDIKLEIEGEKLFGEAVELAGEEKFSYPITGRLNQYCDDIWFSAQIPFNHRIPPKQRAYIKFRIKEAEKLRLAVVPGMIFFLAPEKVEEIVQEARNDSSVDSFTEQVIDGTFSWKFTFVINNELFIKGSPRP